MHKRAGALLALLFGAVAAPVAAQSLGFGLGVQDVVVRAGGRATAPLDAFTQPTAAYGFRKLRTAYSGPGVRIRRASDNAELDINFLGFVPGLGSPLDVAAANAHCAATTCFIRTWYDQSGNARDLIQTVTANQPALVLNCVNSLACINETVATQQLFSAANFTPATGVGSLSVVGRRTAGTGACYMLAGNGFAGNRIHTRAVAGLALNAIIANSAVESAWHASAGVVNGAGSVLNTDGAETTGSITGSTAAGLISISGQTTTACDQTEAVLWDNYVLTPAERTSLTNNQRSFWGF